MSGAHAFLPPSGAGEWVACAMWPTMNALYPQPDTPEAAEGTAGHWVFEQFFADCDVRVGELAGNGVPVSEEMIAGADLYVSTIDDDLAAEGLTRPHLFIERRLAIPAIHPNNWGTPDTWFYTSRGRRLYVYDYKFGHEFVDAFENWQVVDYASGIIDHLAELMQNNAAVIDQGIEIIFRVIQPRNYDREGPVRTWRVRGSDLRAMWNKLSSAAENAHEPLPVATTGAQCKNCVGRAACTAIQRKGYEAVELSLRSTPSPLPAHALAVELAILQDAEKRLKARMSGLEAEAFSRIQRGELVPGYGLEQGVARERWTLPPEQVVNMGVALGVNVAKPGVLTPAQARKVGMSAEVVAAFTERPRGALELARIDNTRLAKVFG